MYIRFNSDVYTDILRSFLINVRNHLEEFK